MENGSIKENYFYNTLSKVINVLTAIITFPYIARQLGPKGLGQFNFTYTIVLYLIILSNLGIPYFAIREISKRRNYKNELIIFTSEMFALKILLSFISLILLFILIFCYKPLHTYVFLFFLESFALLFSFIGIDYIYQGLEKYKILSIINIFAKLLYILLIFFLLKGKNKVYIYAGIIIGISLLSNFIKFVYANKNFFRIRPNFSFTLFGYFKKIIYFFLYNVSGQIYIMIDRIMLGLLIGDNAVGIYVAANKIIRLSLLFFTSMGSVMYSRISYYTSEKDFKKMDVFLRKSLSFSLFLALPLSVGIFTFSKNIVLVFLGNEFILSIGLQKMLSIIIILIALSNVFGTQILLPHKKEKYVSIVMGIAAISNFSLNLILIKKYSFYGAGIASIITELFVTIALIYKSNQIGFNLMSKNYLKYVVASMTIPILYFLTKNMLININILIQLSIYVILSAVSYLFALFLMKDIIVLELIDIIKSKWIRE